MAAFLAENGRADERMSVVGFRGRCVDAPSYGPVRSVARYSRSRAPRGSSRSRVPRRSRDERGALPEAPARCCSLRRCRPGRPWASRGRTPNRAPTSPVRVSGMALALALAALGEKAPGGRRLQPRSSSGRRLRWGRPAPARRWRSPAPEVLGLRQTTLHPRFRPG